MRPQQNRRVNNKHRPNLNRKPQNPLSKTFESNGPGIKIRGNAQHIYEKYIALARDAQAMGDNVVAENFLQHAEHYKRIILEATASQQFYNNENTTATAEDSQTINTNENSEPIAEANSSEVTTKTPAPKAAKRAKATTPNNAETEESIIDAETTSRKKRPNRKASPAAKKKATAAEMTESDEASD